MLFVILGSLLGGGATAHYTWGIFFDEYFSWQDRTYAILTIFLFSILVSLGAFLAGLVGYGIALVVGELLPQSYTEQKYQIGRITKEHHTRTMVVSTGKTTSVIPQYYTTYDYTYFDRETGTYKDASVDTDGATVKLTDDREATLVTREYYFPQDWWELIASPSSTQYTFYVPKGTEV